MPLPELKPPRGFAVRVRAMVRMLLTAGLLAFLLGLNVLQLLSLLFLAPFSSPAFRAFNRWCAGTWWGACVTLGEKINKTRISITGDHLPESENAVIVANHQQMPDILILMSLARSHRTLGDLKFFVKKAIKWVPAVGWGMQFIDCIFIRRHWASDEASIKRAFTKIIEHDIPLWLVSFVEGTRLTPAKLESSRAWAKAKGMEPARHLLVPRTKGFSASVRTLRGHLDAVYDVTIGYVDGVPTLWQWCKGYVGIAHLHVRRFPIESLPADDEGLREWLFDRFREKDRLLEHFYSEGLFPTEALPRAMAVE